jgi:hypothetical protein
MRLNQDKLRVAQFDEVRSLSHLANQPANAVLTHGVGRPMVLASSFVGGPRYNRQLYYDGMAIVRKHGKADLFITFTANANWPEVKAALNASGGGSTPQERYDIISRVFKMKLAQLMADLKAGMLGPLAAYLMVVEWQKRGLPHAHILIFFLAIARLRCVADYDEVVSAEIPDPVQEPELHEAVMSFMLHGPCGGFNPKCPCMKDGKCSKKFPKALRDETGDDEDGFPLYRRRVINNDLRGWQHDKYGDMVFDNTWVVPYNRALLKRYQCHCNVEVCSTLHAVKYLHKYIHKGGDRAEVQFSSASLDGGDAVVPAPKDEIADYLHGRFISTLEAVWRALCFPMHESKPPVMRLQIHLPGQESVIFREDDDVADVVDTDRPTHLKQWFKANADPAGAHLTYVEFPEKFWWTGKAWELRKAGSHVHAIGRIHFVPIRSGDLYFLRVLLHKVAGAKSFEDLRSFEGVHYNSFKEACLARGFLQDDREWHACLAEARGEVSG